MALRGGVLRDKTQFGTEINCLLMKEGMEILENLNEELGWEGDLGNTHGGYIWLAYNDSKRNS